MHPQVLVKTSQSYKLDSQRPEYHRYFLILYNLELNIFYIFILEYH